MSAAQLTGIVAYLDGEIKKVWQQAPEDVQSMQSGKVLGAYRNVGSPILYAESETREMVDYLWNIAELVKNEDIDLGTMKKTTCTILEFKLQKWTAWYRFSGITEILRRAIAGITLSNGKEEFLSVVGRLQILIGKINFWFDALIPWQNVASVFDIVCAGK